MSDAAFEALLEDFVLESRERLDEVEEILLALGEIRSADRAENLVRAKRQLHTLKGNSGMMGFDEMQALAHGMEDEVETIDPQALEEKRVTALLGDVDRFRRLLDRAMGGDASDKDDAGAGQKSGPEVEAVGVLALGSVRVPFAELDTLVDQLAEVVTYRNRLADAVTAGRGLDVEADGFVELSIQAWTEVEQSLETLQKSLGGIQERILQLRMVPLQTLFRPLRRIVHDESLREGKEVRFVTRGGETPLDKALLELASDALGHLVRNAVIHGIESPEERRKARKPVAGTLELSASADANEVRLAVSDDGRGIDVEALRAAAERKGVDTKGFEDLQSLMFLPGVSTRESTDLSSGRGIGMSAVLESVRRQGGRVEIASRAGEGTRLRLVLPLAVSISRALMLRVDAEEYALPLNAIVESLPLDSGAEHRMAHAGVLRWRGSVLPLLDLGYCFGTAKSLRQQGNVVVIEGGGRYRGLVVDEIVGIRDIVVKGLDEVLGAPVGVGGSTVLGDGRVIMILDPPGLMGASPVLGEVS